MAETKTVPTTTTAAATTPPAPEKPNFTFPVVKKFTGKIQYRTNGASVVTTPFGDTLRGEVKEVRSEKYANGLVENGDHAHVAIDTPVGQPDEFRASVKKKDAEPATLGDKIAETVKSAAEALGIRSSEGTAGEALTSTEPTVTPDTSPKSKK
jgi:hypothetical protein